jgi:hypothetical protein
MMSDDGQIKQQLPLDDEDETLAEIFAIYHEDAKATERASHAAGHAPQPRLRTSPIGVGPTRTQLSERSGVGRLERMELMGATLQDLGGRCIHDADEPVQQQHHLHHHDHNDQHNHDLSDPGFDAAARDHETASVANPPTPSSATSAPPTPMLVAPLAAGAPMMFGTHGGGFQQAFQLQLQLQEQQRQQQHQRQQQPRPGSWCVFSAKHEICVSPMPSHRTRRISRHARWWTSK